MYSVGGLYVPRFTTYDFGKVGVYPAAPASASTVAHTMEKSWHIYYIELSVIMLEYLFIPAGWQLQSIQASERVL